MKPELTVFKRITAAYFALFIFNTFLILCTDILYYGFLNFLVALWSIEQIFKLNAQNKRTCNCWREFFSIIKFIHQSKHEDISILRAKQVTDMAIKKAMSTSEQLRQEVFHDK